MTASTIFTKNVEQYTEANAPSAATVGAGNSQVIDGTLYKSNGHSFIRNNDGLPKEAVDKVSGNQWIIRFNTTPTATGGTTAWFTTTHHVRELFGTSVARMTAPAGTGNVTADYQITAIDISAYSSVTLYVFANTPPAGTLNSANQQFTLYLSNDQTFTNFFSVAVNSLRDGLNVLTIPLSAFTSNNSPVWSSIARVRVRVDAHATYIRDITFAGLAYGGSVKPTVVFTADDCGLTQYTVMYPKLQEYGMRATLFTIPQFLDYNASSFTSAQATEMANAGFEFGLHDVAVNADFANSREYGDRLLWIKKEIEKKVEVKACPIVAYPTGQYAGATPIDDAELSKTIGGLTQAGIIAGFVAANDNKGGLLNVAGPINPYSIIRYGFDSSHNLAAIQSEYAKCKATGTVLVVMLHHFGTGYSSTQCDTTDFGTFVDAVGADYIAGIVDVVTAGELVASLE